MINFPDILLPTLDRAGNHSLPAIFSADALSIAKTWLTAFSSLCSSSDTSICSVLEGYSRPHMGPPHIFWNTEDRGILTGSPRQYAA